MNTLANTNPSAQYNCGTLGFAIRRGVVAFIAWRAERAATTYLMAMSDRQLHDIGLVRSEIESAVTGEPMLGRARRQ